MAKRLTDANKWDDPWYQDLSSDNKLAWDYITSKCDSVGVWKPSEKSLKFYVSANVSLSALLKLCGPERILIMPNGNWWLIKFCDFQYGALAEDSKSQTTISYIKLLKKHSLWEAYIKPTCRVLHTPKDKDKEKDKEEDKDKEEENAEVNDLPGPVSEIEIEDKLLALDEIYLDNQKIKWPHINFDFEVTSFKEKVRGSPEHYKSHDTGGIRLAFQSQLRNAKPKTILNGTSKDKSTQHLTSLMEGFQRRNA